MNVPILIVAALVALPAGSYLTYQTLAPEETALATSDAGPHEPHAAPAHPDHERHTGTQTITLAVGVPYPTCPLQCTMGYSFFGSDGLEFDVPEGATSIEVRASWDALPAQELSVGLYHPDEECGEGCWMGVAGDTGSGEVEFTFEDPEPDPYRVSAHGSGPAYAVAKQDVSLEVVVYFS